MAPPTHLQALAGGIGFVAFCWMLWNLNREYKDDQREGDSHDHSTGKKSYGSGSRDGEGTTRPTKRIEPLDRRVLGGAVGDPRTPKERG